ncbi:hypothetical protein ACFQZ4_18055 [Catellatospora coxensis]
MDLHDQSVWQICSECDGSQVGGCPCAGGLMEVPKLSSRVAQLLAESEKNQPTPRRWAVRSWSATAATPTTWCTCGSCGDQPHRTSGA